MRKIVIAAVTAATTALICCSALSGTAFAKTYTAGDAADLFLAISEMNDGDVLEIAADITVSDSVSFNIVKKATINGNGHLIDFGDNWLIEFS